MASGNGGGNDARMKTFAGGWDYVISPNMLSATRISYQHTATLRLQGEGVPTWTSLGVNTFQYTQGNGQDFLRNGTAGWSSQPAHRRVLLSDPVAVAGLRLEQGIAQRSRSAAPGRGRTRMATARSSRTASSPSAV